LDVHVIDYGMGNLASISNAMVFLGARPVVTSDFSEIAEAKYLVLPGVGSFQKAMTCIRGNRFDQALKIALENPAVKVLGVCLGFQLLCRSSTEEGFSQGLGLLDAEVVKFNELDELDCRVPHVGFAEVEISRSSGIFLGLESKEYFYFTHSYHVVSSAKYKLTAVGRNGTEFLAGIDEGRIAGVQFHPEKSQTTGLKLLGNWLSNS
jgi:glutamine amidotransferase